MPDSPDVVVTPAAAPVSAPAPETPPPTSEASAAPPPAPAVEPEYIEARLNGEPFKVPKGLELPLKRGDEVAYEPLEEVRRRGMLERDYRIKTEELGHQQRERAAAEARIQAREAYLAEQEAMLREAMGDPEKLAQWEQHQAMLAGNPIYAKAWEDALAKRQTDAELNALRADDQQRIVASAVENARGWIAELAAKYPTVDPERVRELYARDLVSRADEELLTPAAVEAVYQAEAQYLGRAITPVQGQLKALQDEIAALKAAQAGTVEHAVARAKAPNVAPVGAPPSPAAGERASGPVPFRDLAERTAAWAARR